jgi:hypothetical protein
MVTWHPWQVDQEVLCPFCCHGLPGYVTKVSAEKVVIDHDASEPINQKEGGVGVSPFVLEFFMVQGAGFRCMAYRNGDGKWHEAFNDRELSGAVRILE